ncbi:AAA family ATPase [Dyadobacter sp. 3J3]|uniref:AAA family ATPase n=1 Tax=Dyadobacter sp. 3J3 TaxID=2606600 RepID=UPI001357A50C|nr:AAA family ATPase [Dyadobacter sp. 3J3]
MSNFINQLEIKNFKSIKDLKLDCKRVNVFIGKPNVGKSNILEGIGLLNPRVLNPIPDEKSVVRFEDLSELHFDNDQNNNLFVAIVTNEKIIYKADLFKLGRNTHGVDPGIYLIYREINKVDVKFSEGVSLPYSLPNSTDVGKSLFEFILIDNNFELVSEGLSKTTNSNKLMEDLFSIIKYEFRNDSLSEKEVFEDNLLMSDGRNIFDIVTNTDILKQKIVELFKNDYGLQFVFSKIDKKFFVQKLVDGYIYQYPYSSVADTFQRFIFYLAAIESNTNSVLIFEEPEVHSFPPYVKELAERIVSKDDNQYFISTHSPYMLQTLVEELDDTELNVVLTYYKDYQTFVKVLTAAELREVQDYNIDIFFNLNKFEPNA